MLFFTHPASLEHDPGELMPGHPDTPERIVAIEAALHERGWLGMERREAPAASERQLELVHTPRLIAEVREMSEAGGGRIDADTAVNAATYRAAVHAAGGACELTRALLRGEAEVGYSCMRPSGHHAEPDRAMGFCFFDNVAVAAAMAIADHGLERVMVLDWDVHHGNGTGEIFRRRDDVLFFSLHQSPLYPGTGPASDRGSGPGEGFTVNLPVAPGSGEDVWLGLIDEVVIPTTERYRPQLILVSAGYDAHREDPLASCALESSSFAAMATRVRDLATRLGVPLGLVQEGGYHVPSLVESLLATLVALGAQPPAD